MKKERKMNHFVMMPILNRHAKLKTERMTLHTLLLIGFGLFFGFNAHTAFAQSDAPDGLHMKKTFTPTNPESTEGIITLETFVTGSMVTVSQSIPSDVVIVASMSPTMTERFGGGDKKYVALQNATWAFRNYLAADDLSHFGSDGYHRMATCTFASGPGHDYNHTNLCSANSNQGYNAVSDNDYIQCLRDVSVDWTSYINRFSANNGQGSGAYMQYGLDMAVEIFSHRSVTTYHDPSDDMDKPRGMVVIFLTDGLPGGYSHLTSSYQGFFYDGADNTNYDEQIEADAAVAKADILKTMGATVFSVGIFDGADENAAYQTTKYANQSSQYYNTRWGTAIQACNGLMHFVSSNYPDADSWSELTDSPANIANKFIDSKYVTASNAAELTAVFTTIASQVGGSDFNMTMESVVQDVVSTSFMLPDGANTDVRAYAPLCIGKDGDEYIFESINEAGLLSVVDGVVVECEEGSTGCGENRLSDDLITINDEDKSVQFTGLNLGQMWVGNVTNGNQTTYHGRKLVITFPIVVEEGVWGDAIATNGPMSVILPDNTSVEPIASFDCPIANVIGSVWTEVVTHRPDNFPVVTGDGSGQTISIGTPEELAWFISEVNGRINYLENNNVASHPKLSAILTADIDMSAHNWVPIGGGFKCDASNQFILDDGKKINLAFEGTFDGNGYVITGLKNNAAKYYKVATGNEEQVVVYPGMFSNVKGTVKNVFVLESDFHARNHEDDEITFIHFGVIADTLTSPGQIFNCEAAGRLSNDYDAEFVERDCQLIFGGLVGLNDGGTIHSSMAMVELKGYTLGGAIGENRSGGSFANGFTNGAYNYLGADNTYKVGGIVADNSSTVSNCYVRFERNNEGLDKATFGQVVGSGIFSNCYTPEVCYTVPSTGASVTYTNALSQSRMRQDRSNDNMVGGSWGTVDGNDVYIGGTPLLNMLNNAVGNGQASWKRTTAAKYATSPNGGDINDDYPVLQFAEYKCLASANGIVIDYAATLDQMLERHNTGNMNVNTLLPGEGSGYFTSNSTRDYHVTEHPAIYGGAINLYAIDSVSKSTTANTVVYIDENISLLQGNNSSIEAYTCQTLKEVGASYDNIQAGDRWHNVSSSLQNSMFGLSFTINTQVPSSLNEEAWSDYVSHYIDTTGYTLDDRNPCRVRAKSDDDDISIFPSDIMTFHAFDFYCFDELSYHWINFKRNSASHWHMDDPTMPIEYQNEDHLIPGKGYLMAVHPMYFNDLHLWSGTVGKDRQFLQNRGTLNNGTIDFSVTYTAENERTGLAGYNLLGNPYQSYLDFDKFATVNKDLWDGEAYAQTYAVYDPASSNYVQYKSEASQGAKVADQYLNMHQGFFIRVNKNGVARFDNSMRTHTAGNGFRSNGNRYPLINFTLTDSEGNTDLAVLEVGRPKNDGAKKLRVGNAKARISLRHDDLDFAILFRNMASGSQPLYLSVDENDTFTLSWETANVDFQSLTLVDNITGVKYDMLTHDSYSFEGSTDDYRSRFKIVIDGFTDIEEEEAVLADKFAFFDGSAWIVNGQGQLDVIDLMGRTIFRSTLTNDQNHVNLNGVAQGMYLMQLRNENGVKTQRIVAGTN